MVLIITLYQVFKPEFINRIMVFGCWRLSVVLKSQYKTNMYIQLFITIIIRVLTRILSVILSVYT